MGAPPPLVICTRCGGAGRLKRKDGAIAKCTGCGGVGRREPVKGNARSRRTASPWGLTPLVSTRKALANWDWEGAARKIKAVNAVRAQQGVAPLPVLEKKS